MNPAGVKRDYAIYNDNHEDDAWDAVWDVGDRGRLAGLDRRVPDPALPAALRQRPTHTFGFGVWRDIDRHKERVSWPLYRRPRPAFVSQLGELTGIDGLSSPRRLEIAPYAVTKNVTVPTAGGFERDQQRHGAAPTSSTASSSNLTLDGDGQSGLRPGRGRSRGAQPGRVRDLLPGAAAVLPRGRRALQLRGQLHAVNDCGTARTCSIRGASAARRSSPDLYGDATSRTSTTILGAGKLTGRCPAGSRSACSTRHPARGRPRRPHHRAGVQLRGGAGHAGPPQRRDQSRRHRRPS